MTAELRKMIYLAVELMLLSGVIAFLVLSAMVGRASLNTYSEMRATRLTLAPVVEYTKGTMDYYELVDLIDSYAPVTDVVITYRDNTGNFSTVAFTSALDGKAVKMTLGDTLPVKGEAFTGLVYGRQSGLLYRNGIISNTTVLEADMKLPLNSLRSLNNLKGNGVLDYTFIEDLFDWAKDARFVCTMYTSYDTGTVSKIMLQMQ